ncbi:Clp protease ClpP, partial [Streptococcus danieliae]|nr:Clp protease ClpP [Streptococcus danieliae]
MTKIEIKGTIVSDSHAYIYQYFGIPYTSPASVVLPDNGEDVLVEINSGGGEVFAGSEIFTKLKAYQGKVTAQVVGLAASAASFILMGADEIEISPTAQIMIHNAWSEAVGDSKDMLHEAGVLEGINQSIMKAYMMKSDLTEAELHDLMDSETWMGADRAIELG